MYRAMVPGGAASGSETGRVGKDGGRQGWAKRIVIVTGGGALFVARLSLAAWLMCRQGIYQSLRESVAFGCMNIGLLCNGSRALYGERGFCFFFLFFVFLCLCQIIDLILYSKDGNNAKHIKKNDYEKD
jgi:hypothetical protein